MEVLRFQESQFLLKIDLFEAAPLDASLLIDLEESHVEHVDFEGTTFKLDSEHHSQHAAQKSFISEAKMAHAAVRKAALELPPPRR